MKQRRNRLRMLRHAGEIASTQIIDVSASKSVADTEWSSPQRRGAVLEAEVPAEDRREPVDLLSSAASSRVGGGPSYGGELQGMRGRYYDQYGDTKAVLSKA